jgi:hypothetical protein
VNLDKISTIKKIDLNKPIGEDVQLSKEIHLDSSKETKIDISNSTSHYKSIDLDDMNSESKVDLTGGVYL